MRRFTCVFVFFAVLKQHVMTQQPPNFPQQPQPAQVHVPPPLMQIPTSNMMQQQPPMNNSWVPPTQPPPLSQTNAQLEALNKQRLALLDQIRQSEMNLAAQKDMLQRQQENQMDEIIAKIQNDAILAMASEKSVQLSEFDLVLQPIMDSCTKDSISAGKNFILQHATDIGKCNVLLEYLLKKCVSSMSVDFCTDRSTKVWFSFPEL